MPSEWAPHKSRRVRIHVATTSERFDERLLFYISHAYGTRERPQCNNNRTNNNNKEGCQRLAKAKLAAFEMYGWTRYEATPSELQEIHTFGIEIYTIIVVEVVLNVLSAIV